jgi:hypothetical protein
MTEWLDPQGGCSALLAEDARCCDVSDGRGPLHGFDIRCALCARHTMLVERRAPQCRRLSGGAWFAASETAQQVSEDAEHVINYMSRAYP